MYSTLIGVVIVVILVAGAYLYYQIRKANLRRAAYTKMCERAEDAIGFLTIGVCIVRPGGQLTNLNTYIMQALIQRRARVQQFPSEMVAPLFGGAVLDQEVFEQRGLHLILIGQLITPSGGGKLRLDWRLLTRNGCQMAWADLLEARSEQVISIGLNLGLRAELQCATVVVKVGDHPVTHFPNNGKFELDPVAS